MLPEELRFCCYEGSLCGLDEGDAHRWVYDADQRRWITVSTPILWGSPLLDHDHGDGFDEEWEERGVQAIELVKEHIDTAPADAMGVIVEASGNVRFVNSHCINMNDSTFYPLLESYQLPQGTFKTLLRSDITELDRLSAHVDLVSYPGVEKAAFKYTHHHKGFGDWAEYQIQARLPKHPNLLPLDRLVLDEQTGKRLLGFTTPFVEGGDLDTNKDRLFKLKHLRQLMDVVDLLNYKFGIVHNDLAPRNLFIDPSTDDLILFDFSVSAKIGYEPDSMERWVIVAIKERNDVKGVVMTVHEILTRDPCYKGVGLHYLDETDLLAGPEKWVKHPDVQLEPGIDAVDYYNELMRWVKARRERPITVYTEASEPIDWPRRLLNLEEPGWYSREEAEERGWPYIDWTRPRWAHLDRSRPLLATGKYADDPSGSRGAGWEDEEPVTKTRLKGDWAFGAKPTPVPVATTSNATAEPETNMATDNTTTDNATTDTNITTDNATIDNTTIGKHTTPASTPPSTEPQPQAGAGGEAKTETKTETKTKTETETKTEAKPSRARTRKRAASAALRDGRDGPPAARRSPRRRARSLSRGSGEGKKAGC
ncbi:hypothetical protein B0I37DRAFT_447418 [Chaetomium sp. MPI-CAGE-AT-0009]|nr:hypothetical protein B0I37DRAFT_447418 [Chaetomium sp. MPI-CAGE-AT-0009]